MGRVKFSEDSEAFQQWVKHRSEEVRRVYNAYDALIENGCELVDEYTSFQMSCILPGHGRDANPSARFYSGTDPKDSHYYCFRCKVRLDSVGIHGKLRGLKYTDSLSELEKRFGITPPKFESFGLHNTPIDKSGGYSSIKWGDPDTLYEIAESKIKRNRYKIGLENLLVISRELDFARVLLGSEGGLDKSITATINVIERIDSLIESYEMEREFLESI